MYVHLIASDDPEGVARQFPFYWAACGQSASTTRLSAGEGVSCPACLSLVLAHARRSEVRGAGAGGGEWEFEELSGDELGMSPVPPSRAPASAPPDDVLLRELLLDPDAHPSGAFGVPDARTALTPEERREIGSLLAIIVQFGLSDRALPIARAVFRLCVQVAGSSERASPGDETPVTPGEESDPSEDVTESGDEE